MNPNYIRYTDEILPQLNKIDLDSFKTKEDKLAFWINIYNALVLHSVINFKITKSVKEKGYSGMTRFFSEAAYTIGGYRFSLEEIEHGILRANRGNPYVPCNQFISTDPRLKYSLNQVDPRIHFALNCASTSCPPINFYTVDKINDQLDLATRNFVDMETQLQDKQLKISSIFKWYKQDFGGQKSLIDFLIRYLPESAKRKYLQEFGINSTIKYSPYDWSLNKI